MPRYVLLARAYDAVAAAVYLVRACKSNGLWSNNSVARSEHPGKPNSAEAMRRDAPRPRRVRSPLILSPLSWCPLGPFSPFGRSI